MLTADETTQLILKVLELYDVRRAFDTEKAGPAVLSREELRELTGLARAAAQIRWLRNRGLRHFVRADGKPSVPRSALDAGPHPVFRG